MVILQKRIFMIAEDAIHIGGGRDILGKTYGNVRPVEHKQDYSPHLTELAKRNRAALVAALNDEQKELLEKYESCADEISGFCERDSFIYGFRLGMRLAIEALDDENDVEEL